jgi:hypothetical protein
MYHPEKRGISVRLNYDYDYFHRLEVKIYGLEDTYSLTYAPEEGHRANYAGPLDADKIAADIKKYIETNKDTYHPQYEDDTNRIDAQMMKKISEHYKIKLDPRNFRVIIKKYRYRSMPVKFQLTCYDKILNMELERNEPYSSYNYYHYIGINFTEYGNDVELIMNAAFTALEKLIHSVEPYKEEEWVAELKKKDALTTLKFIKERVFAPRN